MLFDGIGTAFLPNERELSIVPAYHWPNGNRENKEENTNNLLLLDGSMKLVPASLMISTSAKCGGSAVFNNCLWSGGSLVP